MSTLWMLAVRYRNLLWIGFKVTFLVSICAILLGFVLGVIVCFLRLSKNKIINKIAFVYVEIIRGTRFCCRSPWSITACPCWG